LQKLDLHIQKLEQQIRKDTIPKRWLVYLI
jgi:hypothetical protein